jgi:cell division inhibitor SulA
LLTGAPGNGEVSLLLPTLAQLSNQGQWIVLLDPPWVPYPATLYGHGVALERIMLIRTSSARESLWACEQVLRDIRGGAVLAWHDAPGFAQLRRLQVAARNGLKTAFLFRSIASARQASPAPLRLQLEPDTRGTRITVLKCQGRPLPEPILVPRAPELPDGIQSTTVTEQSRPIRLPITSGKGTRVLPVHAH